MKSVPIEELRQHLALIIRGEEPVVVTRYGKPVGILYPLPDAGKIAHEAKVPSGRKAETSDQPLLPLDLDPAQGRR